MVPHLPRERRLDLRVLVEVEVALADEAGRDALGRAGVPGSDRAAVDQERDHEDQTEHDRDGEPQRLGRRLVEDRVLLESADAQG